MFGAMKEAMADAAETLRRAFAGLEVKELVPGAFSLRSRGSAPLAVEARAGLEIPTAASVEMRLLREAVEGRALQPFRAELRGEAGWAQWGSEARVLRMVPLEGGAAARVAVPPLPRRARALGQLEPPARPAARRVSEPLPPPPTRRLDPGLGPVAVEVSLEAMLSLAVPFKAEDIQRLPKGLWMRYSLQLVRGTGENVRNLEVLGLFRLPRKGVADMRHDPARGRILVRLEPAAVKAPRAPFILARRKDDGSLLSCFVEEP